MHLRLRPDRAVRSLPRGPLIAAALAALGIAAAACGGSPSASVANLGSSTTTSSTPAGNTGPSRSGNSGGVGGSGHTSLGLGGISVQFAQCMRTHGVPNFPDPNGQGQVTLSGVDPQSSSFEGAQRACAKYSPNGGKPPSPAQQQHAIAQALKFSECMRTHGVPNFPDPRVSSSGGHVSISIRIGGGQGSNLNPNDPQFQAAQKACQYVAPFGKGAPSPAQNSGA